MKLGNLVRGAMLGLALTGLASAAEATTFKIDSLTFSGSAFSDPGLVVKTNSLAPIEFTLDAVGDKTGWMPLFEIWSEETHVGEDDVQSKSFSLGLNFVSPPPPFGGEVPGGTDGGHGVYLFGHFLFAIADPELDWVDNSVIFNFGVLGDGQLKLTLLDTDFNYDCHKQKCRKAVKGKFELLADASTPVPEPATLALVGVGLSALGIAGMRRRRAA